MLDDCLRQRLEEGRWDLEDILRETNRAGRRAGSERISAIGRLRLHSTMVSPCLQLDEILRKMRLGPVNIELDHGPIVDQPLSSNKSARVLRRDVRTRFITDPRCRGQS